MKKRIIIDIEVDRHFESAEQERYFLASLEEALETEIWFDLIANRDFAPQQVTRACASFRDTLHSTGHSKGAM